MSNFRDIFKNDKDYKAIKKKGRTDDINFLDGMAWQIDAVKNDFAREMANFDLPPKTYSLLEEYLDIYKAKIIEELESQIDEVETSILDEIGCEDE